MLKEAGKIAEECRVQIRKTRDAVVRKHNWKPRTDGEELEQVYSTPFLYKGRFGTIETLVPEARR